MNDLAPGDCSVVVASFSSPAVLEQCLLSIEQGAAGSQVIVATNIRQDLLEPVRSRFPAIRFLACPLESTVFTLRTAGVLAADRPLIILTEDHCTVGPGWLAGLLAAANRGRAVVGGPIANGLRSAPRQWAIYLTEYAAYAPPLPAGEVKTLLAANTAYDRQALLNCRQVWNDGFFDNEVHDALRAAGHALYLEPQAVASTHLDFTLAGAAEHLYAGGKRFGAYRLGQASGLKRILWKAAAPAILVVLVSRLARRLLQQRGMGIAQRLYTFLYIVLLCTAWVSGEARGYFSK